MSPIPPWMIPKKEQPEKRPEQQPILPENEPIPDQDPDKEPKPKRIPDGGNVTIIDPDGTERNPDGTEKKPPEHKQRGVTTIYMDGEKK